MSREILLFLRDFAVSDSKDSRAQTRQELFSLFRAWWTSQGSLKGQAVGEHRAFNIKAVCRQAWKSFHLEKCRLGGCPQRSHDPKPVCHLFV